MADEITRIADRRKKAKACPICGKPPAARYRPFCSARCADVDLNRWLGGVYAVPGGLDEEPADGDDGDEKG